MRVLYEVAYTLSTTMNYQNVLNVALAESRKLVAYASGVVLLSTGQPDELYSCGGAGHRRERSGAAHQAREGPAGAGVRSSDPCLVDDISLEQELRRDRRADALQDGLPGAAANGLRTIRPVLVASDRSNAFSQEQLGMLTALANYAIIALHNAQLVHDLREERAEAALEGRGGASPAGPRSARWAGPGACGDHHECRFIKRLLERDPPRVIPELDRLGALAKHTTHVVRTMLLELRPLVLET